MGQDLRDQGSGANSGSLCANMCAGGLVILQGRELEALNSTGLGSIYFGVSECLEGIKGCGNL